MGFPAPWGSNVRFAEQHVSGRMTGSDKLVLVDRIGVMGRKSSAKSQNPQAGGGSQKGAGNGPTEGRTNAGAGGGPSPLILGAVLVAVVGVGVLVFLRPGSETPAATAATTASSTAGAPAAEQSDNPRAAARAAALASLGPHKQASLPPIPFQVGYAPPRSTEVVTAAYHFAAEHPEILSYVPCFCGCERSGHEGNHDCFVRSRAENGDVIQWDEHGVDCAVCIDVATRSRQMHAAGASATDIRAAIDKEFGSLYPTGAHMSTPHPAH